METAGDIGTVDVRHDLAIQPQRVVAEAFPHIAIEQWHGHWRLLFALF
jgi:hypothetical protein